MPDPISFVSSRAAADLLGREVEHIGHDLREHGAHALAERRRARPHGHLAAGRDGDARRLPRPEARLLQERADADAQRLAGRAPRRHLVLVDLVDHAVEQPHVIGLLEHDRLAGRVQRPRIGHLLTLHQVAAADLDRIEADAGREQVE